MGGRSSEGSNQGRAAAALLTLALAATGCGADAPGSPTTPPPGSIAVTVDAARASTAPIGPVGGTVTATGADGIGYELVVPPSALAQPVEITLTPLSAVLGLPLSGGMAAGADFQPSGLQLLQPATLRMTNVPPAPAGLRVFGLGYRGSGTDLALTPARHRDGAVEVTVTHFSGAVAGYGTIEDVRPLVAGRASGDSQVHLLRYLEAIDAKPRDGAVELGILTEWMEEAVLPVIERAEDDRTLAQAVADLELWLSTLLNHGTFDLLEGNISHPELVRLQRTAGGLIGPKLLAAAHGSDQRCRAETADDAKLAALRNTLVWLDLGYQHNADLGELRRLAEDLCARVAAGLPSLDDPLRGSATLDISFFLDFGTERLVPANFVVEATATRARLNRPGGGTALDPVGLYSTEVHPDAGDGLVVIELTACHEQTTRLVIAQVAEALCTTTLVRRRVEGAPTPPPDCGGRLAEIQITDAAELAAAVAAGLREIGRTGGPASITVDTEDALDLGRLCQVGGDLVVRGRFAGGLTLGSLSTVEGHLEIDVAGVERVELPALGIVQGSLRIGSDVASAFGARGPDLVSIGRSGGRLQVMSLSSISGSSLIRQLSVLSVLETFGPEGIVIAQSAMERVEFGAIVMTGTDGAGLVLRRNARLAAVTIGSGSALSRFELELTQDQRTLPDLTGIACGTVILGDFVVRGRALLPQERDALRSLAQGCWQVQGRISV